MTSLKCKKCNTALRISDDHCPSCGAATTKPLPILIIALIISGLLWYFDFPIIAVVVLALGVLGVIHVLLSNKKPQKEKKTEPSQSISPSSPRNSVKAIDDYVNDLSVIWADYPVDIEFSYIDSNGKRTKRSIKLEEVSVNQSWMPYFVGYCSDRQEKRHFKVNRIASQIKCNDSKYDLSEFLEIELSLDDTLIKRLSNSIASEEKI